MNPLKLIKSNKVTIKIILAVTCLEFWFYGFTLSNLISSLYQYSGNKRVLTSEIAMNVGEAISRSGVFKLFGAIIILLTILPAISFYQYYVGEKSIYTMLRLPGKGARLKLYIKQLKVSVLGLLCTWIWQLLLLLSFYILYIIFVPSKNQPSSLWYSMWSNQDIFKIYPFLQPWNLLSTISVAVLLPATTMLAVLAERSKKQCILAIIGLMVSFYGIYAMTIDRISSVMVVPIATVVTVSMGMYYIYKKQIV